MTFTSAKVQRDIQEIVICLAQTQAVESGTGTLGKLQ